MTMVRMFASRAAAERLATRRVESIMKDSEQIELGGKKEQEQV
jgi:hypothetical protein